MIVIINSSKTMHMPAGNQQPPASDLTMPEFLDEADSLAALLRRLPASELGKLMKTSERLTEQTAQRLSQWRKSAHRANGQPAILTFKGDVYGLRQFDLEGYCYHPDMSTDEKWVFTRKS